MTKRDAYRQYFIAHCNGCFGKEGREYEDSYLRTSAEFALKAVNKEIELFGEFYEPTPAVKDFELPE